MFKNKFKKTIISILFAAFLIPQISLANTPNPTYKTFLQGAKCVPSYVGDPLCDGSAGSSAGGAVAKLYKAIFSQGAVITLLDEPLTSNPEELITVLRMCSYKQGTGSAIVINACSEYYVNSCPQADTTGKFISPELKKTIPANVTIENMAYFTCSTKQVLIAASGTGLIQKYLKLIYNFGTMAAGIFAILMIMFNGIKISVSGSDEGAVDEAKKQITNSLLALTVLFLSGFILYIINPNFFTSI